MAEIDPHGWTLTIISVSVVFSALIVLYFIYNFSGNLFSGKFKRKPRAPKASKGAPSGEVAAAIAMALNAEAGGETEAAIATALHLYLSESVHDLEPGFITLRRTPSAWDDRQFNFRKTPRK
jgi:sodium pump decarboxylase gamma subunit